MISPIQIKTSNYIICFQNKSKKKKCDIFYYNVIYVCAYNYSIRKLVETNAIVFNCNLLCVCILHEIYHFYFNIFI